MTDAERYEEVISVRGEHAEMGRFTLEATHDGYISIEMSSEGGYEGGSLDLDLAEAEELMVALARKIAQAARRQK